MLIHRAGARETITADPAYFTGTVTIDPIIIAPEPASLRALKVHFAPGGRTHWHTHPQGQTLYVTDGEGRVQMRGEAAKIIRKGDTVFIPPQIEHWHGATPDTAMTHIAMQEEPGGQVTDWLGAVSDQDYTAEADT